MAEQSQVLKLLNNAMVILSEPDWNGAIGIEYGPKGEDGTTAASGTVVFEGSISELAWYALTATLPDGVTKVTSLSAPGLASVEMLGYDKVRVRMSVAGGAQGVRVFANHRRG